jgi:cell division protease FtsH
LHAAGKPVSPTVDFAYLARRTPGFTGADLANVVNEAALLTIREGKSEIEIPEFEEAIQRVLSGPKRRGRMLTPEERKRTAYHEAGHCVVAAASGRADSVSRVSILTRSRTVGATTMQDVEASLLTRSQLGAQLVVALGGLAAEELVFGEPSTGAENDLEQATDVARDMVTRYGMAPRLGRARLAGKASDGFLGGTLPMGPISGATHQELDAEVTRIIADAETRAADLLDAHRDVLDLLAARLEAEETIEGADLETVLALVRPEVALFGGDFEPAVKPSRNGRRPAKVH